MTDRKTIKSESRPASADAERTRRIREGDPFAFEQLFRSTCRALVHFAWRYVGDGGIAENLVQDVFVRVWNNRSVLDPELSLRAYLYKAVRNAALQHLRHQGVEERAQPPPPQAEGNPEARLQQREMADAIWKAVLELPPGSRRIFSLAKFDHLTYQEVASVEGISVKTVETQMGRALKALRKKLAHLVSRD